jgi:hypothetical protein
LSPLLKLRRLSPPVEAEQPSGCHRMPYITRRLSPPVKLRLLSPLCFFNFTISVRLFQSAHDTQAGLSERSAFTAHTSSKQTAPVRSGWVVGWLGGWVGGWVVGLLGCGVGGWEQAAPSQRNSAFSAQQRLPSAHILKANSAFSAQANSAFPAQAAPSKRKQRLLSPSHANIG